MIITIDTELLTQEDKNLILDLAVKIKAEKVMFPTIHGKTKETIMLILKHIGGGSILEIMEQTDIPETTITVNLSLLKKAKRIETTISSNPRRYYIKGDNPKLREMLKNVRRRK